MKPLFEKAEAKNKLLRSVAGGGVESLSQLQGRWDKFELMMESHQLMVKEQVSDLILSPHHPTPTPTPQLGCCRMFDKGLGVNDCYEKICFRYVSAKFI